MSQIRLVQPEDRTLATLYGAAMTDDQKKMAVGITAGVLVGIAAFFVIRQSRKKKKR